MEKEKDDLGLFKIDLKWGWLRARSLPSSFYQ